MKKLKDFEADKISLKNIWGGQVIQTETKTKNADGCTVITTDIHYDNNNNGKLDKGDTYDKCIEILCP